MGAKPRADECGPYDIYCLQNSRQFREAVGLYIRESTLDHGLTREAGCPEPFAIDLLGRSVAHGNPVAIALDRLVEPLPLGEDEKDFVAHAIREAGLARGCGEVDRWSPAFH